MKIAKIQMNVSQQGKRLEKTTSHRIRPWSGQQIATGVIENGIDIKKL